MRAPASILLVLALLAASGVVAAPPVRVIQDLDTSVFTCTPNPAHIFIASQAELSAVFSRLAPHCSAAVFEQRRKAFVRDLERARFDWSDEVLVLTMDWYGTGMAKPRLVLSGPTDGLLTSTIRWDVPPPPVTPDTATCRFAFAVRRTEVTRIKVVGQNTGTATFAVSP